MKEIIGKAFNLSNEWKFFVQVDEGVIEEMTYLQLGIYLTSNSERIEVVKIILKLDYTEEED